VHRTALIDYMQTNGSIHTALSNIIKFVYNDYTEEESKTLHHGCIFKVHSAAACCDHRKPICV